MIDSSSGLEGPAGLSMRAAVVADFRESRWWQRVLLVATVGWLAYEWGAGNETLTPWLLVRVIADSSGFASIVATGLVGFGFTTGQQLASGFTTAAGFSMFSRTVRGAWAKLQARLNAVPGDWSKMSWLARALMVFALGTTAVVLIQVVSTGEVGVKRHRATVVQSAVLCGSLVGVAGAIVAGLVWAGRSVDWLESPTQWLLRVLGNPLFWIALLSVFVAVGWVRRRSDPSPAAG